jgi:hypothetical protein
MEVNMKSFYCLVLLVVLLASCESIPTGNALLTAMAQPTKTFVFNVTAIPTTLPAIPIPLADLDLSSVLVLPDDLPEGYSGDQIKDVLPDLYDDLNRPVYQIYQEFKKNDHGAGGVGIRVYDSKATAIEVYNSFLSQWHEREPTEAVADLGDQSQTSEYDLMFVRCNALVNMRFMSTPDYDPAGYDTRVSYARNMDERLTPLVCR